MVNAVTLFADKSTERSLHSTERDTSSKCSMGTNLTCTPSRRLDRERSYLVERTVLYEYGQVSCQSRRVYNGGLTIRHQGAACIQTITHPAISIWSVAVCPNGDIISGASDNVVRVFSRDPSREADADTLRAFSEQVSQQARPAQEIGNIQKDSLPGSEALSKRGKKEGQVIMIRNGNVVEAHQWTESTQSWSKVGEVVDAIGSDRKQMFDGKEYDYVFDVDISENAPPLKLPYNANENPFAAAQSFVKKNELPEQYVDEVANFIMKNTKGSTIDTQQYSDPFTGAGRYIPGAPSTNGSTPQAGPTSTSSHERMTKVLPHRTFLFLKQGNMLAIKQKLAALNKALRTGEVGMSRGPR